MKRILLSSSLSILALALLGTPMPAQTADDDLGDSTSGAAADTSGSNTGTSGSAPAHRHRLLAQLGLTEQQRAQIKQIIQNTTDRKERRQEIKAILTPEQKMKLRELIRARRAQQPTTAQ